MKYLIALVTLVFLFSTVLCGNRPLVIFPGICGSALEAKLDKTTGPHWICEKHEKYFRIWVAVMEMMPEIVDCWSDNMALNYSMEHHTYQCTDGVTMRPIDYGGVLGFDYLDKADGIGIPGSEYFNSFIKAMEKQLDYVSHKDMIGISYDWRYPPHELKRIGFWDDTRRLIENATVQNGGKRAILFAHSMGNSFMMYFLNKVVTKEWKDKYIQTAFTVSGTFGGAPEPLRAVLSGVNDYFQVGPVALVSALKLRPVFQTMGGMLSLLPTRTSEWGDTPIATIAGKDYGISEIPELFQMLGQEKGDKLTQMFSEIKEYADTYVQDPEVPIMCVYSVFTTKNDTEYQYNYKTSNLDVQPEILHGVGDGTVPLASLSECSKWKSTVSSKIFENIDHRGIVSEADIVDYFVAAIKELNAD